MLHNARWSCLSLHSVRWKLPTTVYYRQQLDMQPDIVYIVHIVQTGSCTNLYRCPLACMVLYKAAWGQVVLRYICILVCCCKQLDTYIYTAC